MSTSAIALTVRAHDAAYRRYLIHAARTESIRWRPPCSASA